MLPNTVKLLDKTIASCFAVFMTKSFRPWRVDETWLLPPSVQDFVPAGHPAHLVRDIVREELDLGPIVDLN